MQTRLLALAIIISIGASLALGSETALDVSTCKYLQLRRMTDTLAIARTPANDLFRMVQGYVFDKKIPQNETYLRDLTEKLERSRGIFIWRKEVNGKRGVVIIVPETAAKEMQILLQDLDKTESEIAKVSSENPTIKKIEGNWQIPLEKQSLLQRCASNVIASACAISGLFFGSYTLSQYFLMNSLSTTTAGLSAGLLLIAHLIATDKFKKVFSYVSVMPEGLAMSAEGFATVRKKIEDKFDYLRMIVNIKTGFNTQVNADNLSKFFSTLTTQLDQGESFVTFVSADIIDYGNLTGTLRDHPSQGANTPSERLRMLGWREFKH